MNKKATKSNCPSKQADESATNKYDWPNGWFPMYIRFWDYRDKRWIKSSEISKANVFSFTQRDLVDGVDALMVAYTPVISTGIRDRNHKYIFHGDIVIGDDGAIRVIQWPSANSTLGWICRPSVNGDLYHDETIEVIGNIFENPELLTSKD